MNFCWRGESYQVYKLPTSILSTSELWCDKHPDVPWGSLGWGRETQSKSPNCCDQRLCKIFIRSVNFSQKTQPFLAKFAQKYAISSLCASLQAPCVIFSAAVKVLNIQSNLTNQGHKILILMQLPC